VVLVAELEDGRTIEGESQITGARGRIRRVLLRPADPPALPDALEAIAEADLIVLGPGSLYTSLIPNLLVPGVADALRDADAPRVYICNVMTQPGETDGYSAADHVRAIQAHTGPGLLSHVIVNTQMPQSRTLRERYAEQGSRPVEPAIGDLETMGLVAVGLPLMSEDELLRHDPIGLAAAVLDVMDLAHGRPRRGRRRLTALAPARR
jgi:uncharacterized cofD-like protein